MQIELTNTDRKALVDKKIMDSISNHKFFIGTSGYIYTTDKGGSAKNMCKCLHHFVLPKVKGMSVDHINGNKLDNRSSNLRYCTNNENVRNRKVQTNSTSGIPGVTHRGKWNVWRVRVKLDGIRYHIGDFKDKLEAGYVRDQVALQLHKDFTRTYVIDYK